MDRTPSSTFTVQDFQARWRGATLKERSASQSHFNDLCRALGVPSPTEADPTGAFYAFERGAEKTDGGQGWADVWFRGHFAWEYKGQRADLRAAYRQLRQYVEDLENPPLLVVCDLDRFEVHTNFTGTAKQVHAFSLDDLDEPTNLAVLRALWTDPNRLKPEQTVEAVTEAAAARFGVLAVGLHARGVDPHRAAHFLVQLLFCLFAEDVGLLPKGLFGDLLARSVAKPERFPARIGALLAAMRDGGDYGSVAVDRFNGGLFAEVGVEPLTGAELRTLADAAGLDWGSVEPAIFGTLFERSLDPSKRAQLGAHYTGRADIERVVGPVVVAPLRRRWEAVRAEADALKASWNTAATPRTRQNRREAFATRLFAFQEELAVVRVLDPACGSGNFLYVALAALKDLEKEVIAYGSANGLPAMLPRVGPGQLSGLELNEYAREIAQVVVWIGYLQWMTANGFQVTRDPVLEPLDTIRLQDALLDRSDPAQPKEAEWPEADFIIGNPPFLGRQYLRRNLGDKYVEDLRAAYGKRLQRGCDLVCYFFEQARGQIERGRTMRAGLLANTTIRQVDNREVLLRIKESGDIFMTWRNLPWVLEGASVRIAVVGFDNGAEAAKYADGIPVATINGDLTPDALSFTPMRLPENVGLSFQGAIKVGPFDVSAEVARGWLTLPANMNGRLNSEVVRPYFNGADIVGRPAERWIVDFGASMQLEEASLYEAPFEYVRQHVKPEREKLNHARRRSLWWIHGSPAGKMRSALEGLDRFVVTPAVAKHRLFAWLDSAAYPDHRLCVFGREDDYFFGVLHSRAHEVWSLRMASRHGIGNDPTYNNTTCFETFPLPWPPGAEPADDAQLAAIAEAARKLDDRRRAWLDPEGAIDAELKKRTLTNLYNARPTWLAHLHAALDRAVWAAYGWDDADPAAVEEDAVLARLLEINSERAELGALAVPRGAR